MKNYTETLSNFLELCLNFKNILERFLEFLNNFYYNNRIFEENLFENLRKL